jgi:hypothetical protein
MRSLKSSDARYPKAPAFHFHRIKISRLVIKPYRTNPSARAAGDPAPRMAPGLPIADKAE